jgi:hypothetical protein
MIHLQVEYRRLKRIVTSLSRSAARACGMVNWTARTHFLKLVHVAKIGMKPCELESRLRTNSSHMQPCFSGSLLGCAGRAPAHALHARSLDVQHLCTTVRPQPLSCELTHAPCVQLIHDARERHRMRSSFRTVVTVSRRHTKRSS